jgi:hypothetical protein
MVEFCIGLIGMLAVIGGIFQLGRMGIARTDARVEATQRATSNSMLGSDITGLSIPNYINHISAGGDEYSYSADDFQVGGNEQTVYDRLVDPSRPNLLRGYAPGNDYADMSDAYEMMLGMGLVNGVAFESNIPVLPVVRRLLFNRNSVNIRVSAWMVRTGEIY